MPLPSSCSASPPWSSPTASACLPKLAVERAGEVSRWCLVAAIAALGMKTSFKARSRVGWRPVALMVVRDRLDRRRSFSSRAGVALMAAVMPATGRRRRSGAAPAPGWLVFAVSFGLLLSDYMSRQVLAAVFPLLKAEWGLADGQLGALAGVVALMVGLLTFPLSLLADRIGRVRSVAAMAAIWSLATLACGLATNFHQMLAARFFVGVGEAAYGSVGLAVVFTYFPRSLRATITGAFMAGGVFGSFLGMALGGVVAGALGWRWSFAAMALIGLLLALAYPPVVKERGATADDEAGRAVRPWTCMTHRPGVVRLAHSLSGLPRQRPAALRHGRDGGVADQLSSTAPTGCRRSARPLSARASC